MVARAAGDVSPVAMFDMAGGEPNFHKKVYGLLGKTSPNGSYQDIWWPLKLSYCLEIAIASPSFAIISLNKCLKGEKRREERRSKVTVNLRPI